MSNMYMQCALQDCTLKENEHKFHYHYPFPPPLRPGRPRQACPSGSIHPSISEFNKWVGREMQGDINRACIGRRESFPLLVRNSYRGWDSETKAHESYHLASNARNLHILMSFPLATRTRSPTLKRIFFTAITFHLFLADALALDASVRQMSPNIMRTTRQGYLKVVRDPLEKAVAELRSSGSKETADNEKRGVCSRWRLD